MTKTTRRNFLASIARAALGAAALCYMPSVLRAAEVEEEWVVIGSYAAINDETDDTRWRTGFVVPEMWTSPKASITTWTATICLPAAGEPPNAR